MVPIVLEGVFEIRSVHENVVEKDIEKEKCCLGQK